MSAYVDSVYMQTATCCNCGIVFAMPKELNDRYRREGTWFYCPSGHHQHYPVGKSAEKLAIEARDAAQAEAQRAQAQLNEEKHARLVAEKKVKTVTAAKRKVEQRIAHGVCPCCNKTFADISHHMITDHAEFRLPEGKRQKQIAGAA